MIFEFVLSNGSRYAIDFSFVAMVSKKHWRAIDSSGQEVTIITLISGNEISLSGLHYKTVYDKWYEIRNGTKPPSEEAT